MVDKDTVFEFLHTAKSGSDWGVPVVVVIDLSQNITYVEFVTDEEQSSEDRKGFGGESVNGIAAYGLVRVLYIDRVMGIMSEDTPEPRVMEIKSEVETRYFGTAQKGGMDIYVAISDPKKNETSSIKVYSEAGLLEHLSDADALMGDLYTVGNDLQQKIDNYVGDTRGLCEYLLYLRKEVREELKSTKIYSPEEYT